MESPRNDENLASRGRSNRCLGRIDDQIRPPTPLLTLLQQATHAQSTKHEAVPSIPSYQWFGVRSFRAGDRAARFQSSPAAHGDARRFQRGLEASVELQRGTGGRGSGMKALTGSPPCDLLRATKFFLIGQKPITATAIGIFGANCILDCPVVEAGVCSQPSELPMIRSPVAWAGGTKPLSRYRAGRLASLPAEESEGRQQPRLPDSR